MGVHEAGRHDAPGRVERGLEVAAVVDDDVTVPFGAGVDEDTAGTGDGQHATVLAAACFRGVTADALGS